MVYSYLLDLYRDLAEREKEIVKQREDSSISPQSKEYLQGRLDAVNELSSFLKTSFHEQLPRRLRRAVDRE